MNQVVAVIALVMMVITNITGTFMDMVFWGFILCAALLNNLRSE